MHSFESRVRRRPSRWLRILGLGLVGFLSLGLAGCRPRGQGRGTELSRETLIWEGRERVYFLPPEADRPVRPQGLVLILHGGMGSGSHIARAEGRRLEVHAKQVGFLTVYPNGVDRHWNDGRLGRKIFSRRKKGSPGVDDVGFLDALVKHLLGRHSIPGQEVFVAGISNGGRMTLRLLQEKPAWLKAAAVLSMGEDPERMKRAAAPSPGTPVVFFGGTQDAVVPYQGGSIRVLIRSLGESASMPETAAYFARSFGTDRFETQDLPDRDPGDGSRVRLHRFGRGEVLLYEIQGGGHTWAGIPKTTNRLRRNGGTPTRDIHASDEIAAFWGRFGFGPRTR